VLEMEEGFVKGCEGEKEVDPGVCWKTNGKEGLVGDPINPKPKGAGWI